MSTKIGVRVGAWLSATKEKVLLLGYGVYVGDEIPDENAGGFGSMIRDSGGTNPKIVLDDGKVIWGCECWFGPEEQMKKRIDGREVVPTDIDESRKMQAAVAAAKGGAS